MAAVASGCLRLTRHGGAGSARKRCHGRLQDGGRISCTAAGAWPTGQCFSAGVAACLASLLASRALFPAPPPRLTTMPTATSARAHTLAPSPAELYSDSLLKALCGKCVLSMALNTFRNRLRFTSHLMSQVGAPAQTDRSLEDERGGLLWVPVRLAGVLGQWKLEGAGLLGRCTSGVPGMHTMY